MKNRICLKFIENKKTASLLILLLCACVGCYLMELDYHIRHILNGVTGFILLFGVAFLCFPQNGNPEYDKTSQDIPDLKKYKLVAGTKSTDSRLFASEQEAWDMLSRQLPGISPGYATLYVYKKEKFPFIRTNTEIRPSHEEGDISVINYWKPVCVGVL